MNMIALIAAVVLAAVVVGLLIARARMGTQLERLAAARPCSPAEVPAAGPGTLVRVSGVAVPGSGGPLRAPVSGEEVVWHRILVTEEYETTDRDSNGRTTTRTETRTVSDDCSTTPFLLAGGDARVELVPAGRHGVRDAQLLTDQRDLGGMQIGPLRISAGTKQRVQEWGVPVGTTLYAVGELSSGADGTPRLDANVDRRLRVSLLDPETQTAKAVRTRMLLTIAAAVSGLLAVVTLVWSVAA
jgi:hypothetical protein